MTSRSTSSAKVRLDVNSNNAEKRLESIVFIDYSLTGI
jgi:hypothetical protein